MFPLLTIYLLVILSGFAALSWEVMWQIKSTLALGVSAWGTAITLIVTMSGMSLGSFLMGKFLHDKSPVRGLRFYAWLELLIGIAGLFLGSAFWVLEKLDIWFYTIIPYSTSLIYFLGMSAICGLPTLCMGATLPVFGLISKNYQVSIAKLYSLNTLGAAAGVLVVALIAIPWLGVRNTIWVIAATNITIGLTAWLLSPVEKVIVSHQQINSEITPTSLSIVDIGLVFVTGFATFTLEIAWFRALLTIYPSTTDVFALILSCMLIALGLAAKKVPTLKQKKKSLGIQLCIAGILILLWTPLIERLDNFIVYYKQWAAKTPMPTTLSSPVLSHWLFQPNTYLLNGTAIALYVFSIMVMFIWVYVIIVPAVRFLGVAFPWILDNQTSSSSISKLYAINTLAAVIGSISAAWILLPSIGFAKTAWIAGALVVIGGISILPTKKRILWIPLGLMALFIAIYFQTGIGKTHIQGFFGTDEQGIPANVLGFFEGPDATVSAIEYKDGSRALLINSTMAALESGRVYKPGIHYMEWMGHLPMLLQPDPKNALVICFGTGQTANAVREENPLQLDIVDINSHVYDLAHFFRSNKNVLADARVNAIVMDGRAYLRRTHKRYDIITLEPLPPGAIGVNALYSKEFYELARTKMTPNGVIAQWLPFHGVSPHYTASIAKTFIEIFPNAILWIDPDSKTGILLGSKNDDLKIATNWPGLSRTQITRDLSNKQIESYVALNASQLKEFAQYGEIITDDNQRLSYGKVLYEKNLLNENFELLHRINNKIMLDNLAQGFILSE